MNPSPMAVWKSGFDAWRMLVEAQAVIGLRMMGMAGLWTLSDAETTRMVAEKQQAFARSLAASSMAAMRGQPALSVAAAAMAPYGQATRGNVRRLSRAYTKQLF